MNNQYNKLITDDSDKKLEKYFKVTMHDRKIRKATM